jgi:membrane associated rhomboid family serine protease
MLSDRPYMRNSYQREGTSVHIWVISVLAAAYVIELVLLSPWWPGGGPLIATLPLTSAALHGGEIWRLLSYSLLHDTHNPFHLLFVLISLAYIGGDLVPRLGTKRFLAVLVATIGGGGLTWTVVHWSHGGTYFGAGAGVMGLFTILALLEPQREVRLMFLPMAFNARQILWALLVIDLFCFVLYEILGAFAPIDFSPSAHLGSMAIGWLYYNFIRAHPGWTRFAQLARPAWLGATKIAQRPSNTSRGPQPLGPEVDRILDKINHQGFGTLTVQEKKTLDEAKNILNQAVKRAP